MKPKKPSLFCKRGHRKSGRNLITRIRDGKKILECRTCANASLQARREARKRNAALILEVSKSICDEDKDSAVEYMHVLSEHCRKRNAKLLKGEDA